MRITEIHIDRWRNLRDISYEVPYDSTLVALVGSNGTGKTSLLELLSFAAAHFGMAAGVRPQQRSSPPPEAAARIVFYVSDDVELPRTAVAARLGEATDAVLEAWDRTLVLWQIPYVPAEPPRGVAQGYAGTSVVAGGLDYPHSQILAETVVQTIHQRLELNHLFLDAERTFGPVDIRDEQILAASREDPNEPSRERQQPISATANM
jgi:ABC-type dipeptide/oligopeptide/nickel transport system ATPase subunit